MLKKALGIAIIAMFVLVGTSTIQHEKNSVKPDPNIVHYTASNGSINISQLLGAPEPEYNPFEKEDVLTVDRKTNTFHMYEITDKTFEGFETESNMMQINGVKDITINLHSPGGELESAAFIVEQIRILKAHGITVHTVIDEKNACMSACPLIYLTGDTRTAYANSVIMLHAPYVQFPYNTPEPVYNVVQQELRIERDKYVKVLQTTCSKDPSIGMDVIDHHEHFYRADDLDTRCGSGTFFTKIIPVVDDNKTNPFSGITIPGLTTDSRSI
jgi:ATP-dependent protease ClpP protease subunit